MGCDSTDVYDLWEGDTLVIDVYVTREPDGVPVDVDAAELIISSHDRTEVYDRITSPNGIEINTGLLNIRRDTKDRYHFPSAFASLSITTSEGTETIYTATIERHQR